MININDEVTIQYYSITYHIIYIYIYIYIWEHAERGTQRRKRGGADYSSTYIYIFIII